MTSMALLGTRQAPLVCSPLYLSPSTTNGSEAAISTNWMLRSPLPQRKHICVSGSNRGTRMLNGKGIMKLVLEHYRGTKPFVYMKMDHFVVKDIYYYPADMSSGRFFTGSEIFLKSRIVISRNRS